MASLELLASSPGTGKTSYCIERFKNQDELFDYKTKDTFLIDLIQLYQTYWKNILLQKQTIEKADIELKKQVGEYLRKKYSPVKESADSFPENLSSLLNEKGYYNTTGRIGGFFDLLIWTKESFGNYEVELPEQKTNVKVNFLEDFISLGWEDYATFNKHYPGGWAGKDTLYCVKSMYDTSSEKFKVSYLKHETQHFEDYKLFPNLSGADLEYRAKLTELNAANSTIYNLITFFIHNANNKRREDAHAFANYYVIRDLSQAIFKTDFVDDIAKWKAISANEINSVSMTLLIKNSENLKKAGGITVVEFIK